jgi:RNA polymerase sigma-70 factor, ECF subfamily
VSTESFEHLMERLKKGDGEAADAVFQLYVKRLAALVRSRLSGPLRQKIDPEDVTQSAFRTFFRRMKKDEFHFGGWEHLWTLLALLTLRKFGHQIEHFQAACRDVHREVPTAALSQDSSASWIQIAREPTPPETAMLTETVERLLSKLKERQRPIFLLSLQGYTAPEISAQVGRAERTVYRVLDFVKKELQRASEEDRQQAVPSAP